MFNQITKGDYKNTLVSKGIKTDEVSLKKLKKAIDYFGLESKQKVNGKSVLDAFCAVLEDKLEYQPNERDMVAMHHEFGVLNNDGKESKKTSTMIVYGNQEYSAMAKTVGFPAAMVVDMILKDEIKTKGVLMPLKKEIYEPVIEKLNHEGIRFLETEYNLDE